MQHRATAGPARIRSVLFCSLTCRPSGIGWSFGAVVASESALGRLQAPFDHVQQALRGALRLRAIQAAQWPVDEQHRQAVHRRSGQKLRARTTLAGRHARLDEPVESAG